MQRPRADQLLLAVIVLGAGVLSWSSATLIVPYPAQANWYESAAMFPRVMLGLVMLGGISELLVRRRGVRTDNDGSEELDSSAVQMGKAVLAVAMFMAYTLLTPWLGYAASTLLYVFAGGVVLGLGWRTALLMALPLAAGMWLVFVKVLQVAFGHGLLP